MTNPNNWIVPLLLLAGIITSIFLKKLTFAAAITGGLLGWAIYAGGGYRGLLFIAVFFLSGTVATSWKKKEKSSIRANAGFQSTRTTGQVIANAGVAALAGGLSLLFPAWKDILLLMMAGSMSAAMADTLSSELGMVYGRRFYNILTGKPDEKGLDGVISLEGLLIGVAGSALIAVIYILGQPAHIPGLPAHTPGFPASQPWIRPFEVIVLAGTLGNLADSLLGALLERRGRLSNNAVNFLNTLVGALAAGLLFFVFLDHPNNGVKNISGGIDTTGLRDEIMAEFGKHPEGVFAVAFKDIGTGRQFLINEHDNFHAASTMKTPVMIETFRQAAAHKFSLTDSVTIHTNFTSITDSSTYNLDSTVDSEKDLYRHVGARMTIRDLLYRMITQSSNVATNMIIAIVGARNVNATMRSLGANDIRVLRGVEDTRAFKKGLNNTTTAYDLMLIMEHIARKDVVSEAACDDMIGILLDQHFKDVIAGKLPPDVKVASKSGSIDGIHHDSGIVFLPNGQKYVVVLLSRGIASQDVSIATLANVSRIIYDHVTSK